MAVTTGNSVAAERPVNDSSADRDRCSPSGEPASYDRLTILLHWTTAVLVVALYGLAKIWSVLERGTALRHALQSLHVSLGLVLTAVLVTRMLWRVGPGRKLQRANAGLPGLAATAVHYALYLMLACEVVLGWCFRWAQGEPLSLFGLFVIPSPIAFAPDREHTIAFLHDWTATAILIVAGSHALAALFHHYVLRDGVLIRMWPVLRARLEQVPQRSKSTGVWVRHSP